MPWDKIITILATAITTAVITGAVVFWREKSLRNFDRQKVIIESKLTGLYNILYGINLEYKDILEKSDDSLENYDKKILRELTTRVMKEVINNIHLLEKNDLNRFAELTHTKYADESSLSDIHSTLRSFMSSVEHSFNRLFSKFNEVVKDKN